MLSLFPQILFLAPLGLTLIRVALAVLMVYDAFYLYSHKDVRHQVAALCAVLVAVLFFVGAWTQLAALAFAISFVIFLVYPYPNKSFSGLPRSTIALAVVMALVLVISGAGAFAFDLPL